MNVIVMNAFSHQNDNYDILKEYLHAYSEW